MHCLKFKAHTCERTAQVNVSGYLPCSNNDHATASDGAGKGDEGREYNWIKTTEGEGEE